MSASIMARHVRTEILRFLAENPRPGESKDSYWTSYGIAHAKTIGLEESTVWKVTKKFRECGILEPEEKTLLDKPEPTLRDETTGEPIGEHRSTVRTHRGGIPCRLRERGKRLAALMKKLEDEKLVPTGFRTTPLSKDADFLARIAPFTAEDIEAAKNCKLIAENRPRGYEYLPGLATPPTVSSILGVGTKREVIGYRYRIA
jgi:hypothetical protein